jgi:hypothetical protein
MGQFQFQTKVSGNRRLGAVVTTLLLASLSSGWRWLHWGLSSFLESVVLTASTRNLVEAPAARRKTKCGLTVGIALFSPHRLLCR